jgi:hypothetical protein
MSPPTPKMVVSAQISSTGVFACLCGCDKLLPNQESLAMHAKRQCCLCGRKFRRLTELVVHEDTHLDSDTPSHPLFIRGVRCLGCYIKFSKSPRTEEWANHKRLSLCSRKYLEDPSTNFSCAPAKEWEAANLGKSRNRELAIRPSEDDDSLAICHTASQSEVASQPIGSLTFDETVGPSRVRAGFPDCPASPPQNGPGFIPPQRQGDNANLYRYSGIMPDRDMNLETYYGLIETSTGGALGNYPPVELVSDQNSLPGFEWRLEGVLYAGSNRSNSSQTRGGSG